MTSHNRLRIDGALCALALAVAIGCTPQATQAQPAAGGAAAPAASLEPWRDAPVVIVRSTRKSGPLELVTFEPTTLQVRARTPLALACERVHAGGERIACLHYEHTLPRGTVIEMHDWRLQPTQRGELPAGSLISRARVSSDGRLVAATVFVSGHSYASPGQFSTLTQIWNSRERRLALSLDKAALTHEGQRVTDTPQTQLNFWGVTFDPRDADRFYVTAAIRRRPWLAVGSLSRGTIRTLRPDVECPSMSPDGTRIAFKKLRPNGRTWDPAVLDLATGQETVLPAAKGVDDQIEWLDDDTLLYEATETRLGGAKTDLMLRRLRPADAREELWLADAASPGVHRKARAAGPLSPPASPAAAALPRR